MQKIFPKNPYTVALGWLARREYSVAQVRRRLLERGYRNNEVDNTINSLRQNLIVDDERTALTHARTAVSVRLRGRVRVLRDIEALGINREVACAAVATVFSDVNEAALLEKALARRLRREAKDRPQLSRLYQYLLRQGFEPEMAIKALKTHTKNPEDKSKIQE